MKKLSLAAGLALAFSAGSALAADLPRYKAPPLPPPPMFSWTGLYAGVNIGYGFGAGDQDYGLNPNWGVIDGGFWTGFPGTALTLPGPTWFQPSNLNGVTGGAQLGANYQFNSWLVLGVETDIQAAGLKSASQANIGFPVTFLGFAGANSTTNTITNNVDWWGTLRARVGLTPLMPNLMIYGTGGLAYGQVNSVVSNTSAFFAPGTGAISNSIGVWDNVKFGWTAGAGLEWAPMSFPNWSLRVEYLYTDLGATTINSAGFGIPTGFFLIPPTDIPLHNSTSTVSTRWHTVRAAVNYRFNFAPAPVVAKF